MRAVSHEFSGGTAVPKLNPATQARSSALRYTRIREDAKNFMSVIDHECKNGFAELSRLQRELARAAKREAKHKAKKP